MRDLETRRLVIRAFAAEDLRAFRGLSEVEPADDALAGEFLTYCQLADRVTERLKQPPLFDQRSHSRPTGGSWARWGSSLVSLRSARSRGSEASRARTSSSSVFIGRLILANAGTEMPPRPPAPWSTSHSSHSEWADCRAHQHTNGASIAVRQPRHARRRKPARRAFVVSDGRRSRRRSWSAPPKSNPRTPPSDRAGPNG